ncbi:uncharacterized protein PFLUO_LOCUS4162 [Penicillium psychrofluorescens]|uniref:uncharacterized protein n=1 Tax=Penicillium psychrofluorescens TaxID=3158075 RepID=UPI003CCD524E
MKFKDILSPLLLLPELAAEVTAGASSSGSSSSKVPLITKQSTDGDRHYLAPYFPLLGFEQYEGNPILLPNPKHNWESAYLYNPTAIVVDDMVMMLYRAQNKTKTSSVGLAWSSNGVKFSRYDKPVLEPTEPYETPGGCEDPRVVRVNGTFYMTYTGFDGTTARLCLATSADMVHWKKHGPILPNVTDVQYDWENALNTYKPRAGWSKSGSILNEPQPDGTYRMLFGDSFLYQVNSTDLIHWNYEQYVLPYAAHLNPWEQAIMESGPPAIKTRDGKWLQFYNGVATGPGGFTPSQYSTGQMLIDLVRFPHGPPVARVETPLLQPTSVDEITGQVDHVVFTEGLVQFHEKWFMYFGQGDQYLGVATAPVQP